MADKQFTSSPLLSQLLATAPAWVIIFLLRLNTPHYVGDDAYMTFKVGRNLFEGNGFVFNAGEYVSVATASMWAALVGLVAWLFSIDPTEAYRPLQFLLELTNCFLLVSFASVSGRYLLRGAICALLFALSWHMTLSSVVGMEPNLTVALMLSALLLQRTEKTRFLSGFFAAAVFLCRPEGMMFIVAIGICRLFRDRRLPWPEIISGSIVVGIYLSWFYYYFGSILPHAGLAKSIAYYREPMQAFHSLCDHIMMLTLTPWFDSPGLLGLILPFGVWAIWLYGVCLGAKQSIEHLVVAVYTLLVIALFTVMNPMLFEWYVVSLEVSYLVSLIWGVCGVLQLCSGVLWSNFYPQAATAITMIMLFIGVARFETPSLQLALKAAPGGYRHWPSLIDPALGRDKMQLPVLGPAGRESLYIELAKSLENEVDENTVIIAPEYGAFGYYSKAKMLSSIGHTSNEMFKYLPAPRDQVGTHINNSITQAMIDGFRPDYVLSFEAFIRKSLLVSEKFAKEYEIVEKIESSVFGSDGLYLFRRIETKNERAIKEENLPLDLE